MSLRTNLSSGRFGPIGVQLSNDHDNHRFSLLPINAMQLNALPISTNFQSDEQSHLPISEI